MTVSNFHRKPFLGQKSFKKACLYFIWSSDFNMGCLHGLRIYKPFFQWAKSYKFCFICNLEATQTTSPTISEIPRKACSGITNDWKPYTSQRPTGDAFISGKRKIRSGVLELRRLDLSLTYNFSEHWALQFWRSYFCRYPSIMQNSMLGLQVQ